ncbi:hypothetical protein M8C21_008941 [Ambrosia artemisiifolia]|uniref:Uncharacterized protein n=1 Tax=Ambrosia artemisiifolia TaxID=4212 RepID=A0AAD5GMN0_AMBAR|nr:hypothetical protein M8C21_008941 [Ambrosia artemisiifolia]
MKLSTFLYKSYKKATFHLLLRFVLALFSVPGDMKNFNFGSLLSEPKSRTSVATFVLTASLLFGVYLLGTAFYANDLKILQRSQMELKDAEKCKNRCRPPGSEALPEGVLAKTSDLEMRPLWGSFDNSSDSNRSVSLLAIAAGIKQKDLVNNIITKFLENDFVVMVFHYDGIVDQWNDLQWASRVIHVSAMNQTKWFAKRFLHPDIVAEYDYIFLWDEDLDITQFNPGRYISIVKEEELDISQPALDPRKSEIHHHITVRQKNSKVHRRYFKFRGGGKCYDNSTGPPCFGWVEMMAPVFSKAAWRCAWYLIQKVGVVDAEYIVHLGVPSLGGSNHASNVSLTNQKNTKNSTYTDDLVKPSNSSDIHAGNDRAEVRLQSYTEMRIFWRRWDRAVKDDKCWVDRYAYDKRKTI